MDTKEKSLLAFYYEKLMDNTFDEKDVYGFLPLIQNRSEKNGAICELADFVFKRDRHEGAVREYLFATKKKFENIGKTKAAIRIEDVFSFRDIRNGINHVLEKYEMKPLANEKINDFITCLISILQQIPICDQDREVGKLFFAISKKQIILMAEMEVSQNFLKKRNAVFPVLTTNNSYLDMKKQDKYDTPYLFIDKVIEITNNEGSLEIVVPV